VLTITLVATTVGSLQTDSMKNTCEAKKAHLKASNKVCNIQPAPCSTQPPLSLPRGLSPCPTPILSFSRAWEQRKNFIALMKPSSETALMQEHHKDNMLVKRKKRHGACNTGSSLTVPTLNPFSLAKFKIIPLLSRVVLVASKTFKSKDFD